MQRSCAVLFALSGTMVLAMEQTLETQYSRLFQKYLQKKEKSCDPKLVQEYQQELGLNFQFFAQEEATYTDKKVHDLFQELQGTTGFGLALGGEKVPTTPKYETRYEAAVKAQKSCYRLATSNYGRLFHPHFIYTRQYMVFNNLQDKIKDQLSRSSSVASSTRDEFVERYNTFVLVATYAQAILNLFAQPKITSMETYYQKECSDLLKKTPTSLCLQPDVLKKFELHEEVSTHLDTGVIVASYK